jgi:hypothetical protein
MLLKYQHALTWLGLRALCVGWFVRWSRSSTIPSSPTHCIQSHNPALRIKRCPLSCLTSDLVSNRSSKLQLSLKTSSLSPALCP